MPSSLYKNEVVYDHSNFAHLLGDKTTTINGHTFRVHDQGGEHRIMSCMPKPAGVNVREFAADFADHFQVFDESEWEPRAKEQLDQKRRNSDVECWDPLDQDGTPQCWANSVAGPFATSRVRIGLPYIQFSPASLAVPISGGRQGGWEGDAIKYGMAHGIVPSSLWPQHSCEHLDGNEKVKAARAKFLITEVYDCGDSYAKMVSALLQDFTISASFGDWGHAVEIADFVVIERGSVGHRIRNSWNGWGAKNDAGFAGYATFRRDGGPHCRPGGIWAIRQTSLYAGTEYLSNVA